MVNLGNNSRVHVAEPNNVIQSTGVRDESQRQGQEEEQASSPKSLRIDELEIENEELKAEITRLKAGRSSSLDTLSNNNNTLIPKPEGAIVIHVDSSSDLVYEKKIRDLQQDLEDVEEELQHAKERDISS